MKPVLGHKMILASAGSGKTYTLVNRYIRLLALGVPAARINALTFTRKAAGEFLQKIFLRLSEAAADPTEARKLAAEIELDNGSCASFRAILTRLVHDMGDLQLGTIDSFFARVVGAFPYEVGLTRPHRIMDDFEQNVSRMIALERLFGMGDEEQDARILQLYKEMTWGAQEKRVYSLFEDNLKAYHTLFLEAPDAGLWGRPERIFSEAPWWAGARADLDTLLGEIAAEMEELELNTSQRKAFEGLFKGFDGWQPGMPLKAGKFFESLLENRAELASGSVSIKVNRSELELAEPMAGLLFELLRLFVGAEVGRRLVTTHSLGGLISQFDRLYEQSIREAGSLVFADLPMLLIKALCEGESAFDAADIIYRLDGQTDHWLVDEFQDTSRIQWKVLSAFIDEVLQDPSGERTFFYVGDIKQSIYRWRGGDSRLFDEIYQQYSVGESGIQREVLSKSWRSAPPVLDCVNALFGTGITPELAGGFVADRWNRLWQEHVPSSRTQSLTGHAAWGLLDAETPLEEGCIELLRSVDPLGKDLTCAVLMRKNTEVTAMTQALREAGIPASMEGQVEIAKDNIVGTWMRAFLYALARPDEPFARSYLSCAGFPFDDRTFNGLADSVRAALTRDGCAEAARQLIGFVLGKLPDSPFLRRRGEQLLEAATGFEANGVQPLEQFISYLEAARVEESTLQSQVQVMTVHKAKGLDFDMVVVAGFGGDPLVRPANRGLHVERETTGTVDWILDLPNKLALEQDPVLRAAEAGERNLDTFEALCLLYVAMTRARMGLYCLSNTPGRNSSQLTWHQLFENVLGSDGVPDEAGLIAWQRNWGPPDWHLHVHNPPREPVPPVRIEPLKGPLPPVRPNLRRAASPSQESHAEESVVRRLRSNAGRRFGSRMHEVLATIGWVPGFDEATLDRVVSAAPEDLRERIRQLLHSPLGQEVFAKPDQPVDLWREKPYILRRQQTVASGIIDRAHLFLDAAGNPAKAVIYDFKTDVLDPARPADEQLLERYAVQLDRYREALCLLTGLPGEAVSVRLVPV